MRLPNSVHRDESDAGWGPLQAVRERPRPTAWGDGASERPIGKDTPQRPGRAKTHILFVWRKASHGSSLYTYYVRSQEELKAGTRGERFV
jgi:hypothetical protein